MSSAKCCPLRLGLNALNDNSITTVSGDVALVGWHEYSPVSCIFTATVQMVRYQLEVTQQYIVNGNDKKSSNTCVWVGFENTHVTNDHFFSIFIVVQRTLLMQWYHYWMLFDTTSVTLSTTYMFYSQNYDWLSWRIIRVMGKYVCTHEKRLMWYSVTVKRISYPYKMRLN